MANYATIAQGDTYFAGHLNTDPWDDATDANKTKALTEVTRAIDRLNFQGELADEDQSNQFPRGDDTTVPTDIQYACLEESLIRLDDIEVEQEISNLRMKSQGYANIRSTYDSSFVQDHIMAGIMSVISWQYLQPYLRDSRGITISRV